LDAASLVSSAAKAEGEEKIKAEGRGAVQGQAQGVAPALSLFSAEWWYALHFSTLRPTSP